MSLGVIVQQYSPLLPDMMLLHQLGLVVLSRRESGRRRGREREREREREHCQLIKDSKKCTNVSRYMYNVM